MYTSFQRNKVASGRCWLAVLSLLRLASSSSANAQIFTGGTPDETCWGVAPTIVCPGGFCAGTAGADVILGSPEADQIYAGSGDDIVCGRGGDDRIYGNFGDDNLFGQDGNDTVYGESGRDVINGNRGADTLYGGTENDRLFGDDGTDVIFGQDGDDRIGGGGDADTLSGGNGADTIDGEGGNDVVRADAHNDVVRGGSGNDTLEGGTGNDRISGQSGADLVRGQDGHDALLGGDGNDTMYGGTGDDQLDGDAGDDALFGDDGNDQLFGDVGANDACDGGPGIDEHFSGATCETAISLELPAPDDGDDGEGNSLGAPCDAYEQDCQAGLKCANGDPNEPPVCQPLDDNPDQVGDVCDASEDGDSCDVGSVCIHGLCVAQCGGTPAAPTCPSPDDACHIYDDGGALCELTCDPLVASACPNGWKCTAASGSLEVFTCAPEVDEVPDVLPGGSCTQMSQCQQGFACLQYDTLLDYCDEQSGFCCSPMCDVDEPGVCPDNLSCIGFYPEGAAPPGLEHVGVCAAFL